MKTYAQKRMQKLATFLRTVVRPKQFDMDQFWREDSCGTIGCMAGWAATIPSFKKAGLKLDIYTLDDELAKAGVPNFRGKDTFEAMAEFFDITHAESVDLFCSCDGSIKTPKQGATRLERFLHQKEQELCRN